ncbi:hypothetical protein IFM89_004204 [Coptis chinensis]|uniref:Bifunctional inhibitor/plant lipid transfer protein/seed storage helical domain-containing protein n=1 Tax=Coptis chinensis TaxID=261450 RepID=A0A835I8Z5_9MAGN|nr:hypothetical protein IFM89_004204 [Coptis chinensis]
MKLVMVCCVMLMPFFVGTSTGTMQDDEKECAPQLTNLAACIPYVSGTASKPTKQCCEDTMKVKNEHPKCLCVLIQESTDPSMGLPVNTTLAMQMPAACNIDAKPSECPAILKLPPNSPDAKIFQNAGTSTPTTTSPPSDSGSASTTGTATTASKVTPASSSGAKLKLIQDGALLVLMVCCSAAWMFM